LNSKFLPITINTKASLPINVQITEQIKFMIAMETLKPGDAMPTVINLADFLNVNHNTIAAVYAYLIEIGYLVAQRGKGTFVAQNQIVEQIIKRQQFYQMLKPAASAAIQFGLDPSEFASAAYAQAISLNTLPVKLPLLIFVECHQHDANSYLRSIESNLGCHLELSELEKFRSKKLEGLEQFYAADLIITPVYHLQEVLQYTTSKQEVIGVNPTPTIPCLIKLSALSGNTIVWLIGRESSDCKTMKQIIEQTGISHLKFWETSFEDFQKNLQLLEKVSLVCVSGLVYDHVRQFITQPEKLLKFDFEIDKASITVLKTRLATIQSMWLPN
jgi:DNA-binding transcriptional regulator YhcF (GntR family)